MVTLVKNSNKQLILTALLLCLVLLFAGCTPNSSESIDASNSNEQNNSEDKSHAALSEEEPEKLNTSINEELVAMSKYGETKEKDLIMIDEDVGGMVTSPANAEKFKVAVAFFDKFDSPLEYINAYIKQGEKLSELTTRYYADIDGDNIEEAMDISDGGGSIRGVDLIIKKVDSLGEFAEFYDSYETYGQGSSSWFSYTYYSPCIIEIKGSAFIAENRDGVLTLYRLNSEKKELENIKYIFGKYGGNPKKKMGYSNRAESHANNWVNVEYAKDFIEGVKDSDVIEIDAMKIGTESEFFKLLHNAFKMPIKYNSDKNGVTEGLKDLSWLSKNNYSLVIWNADERFGSKKDSAEIDASWLYEYFGDDDYFGGEALLKYWHLEQTGLHSFSVLFVGDSRLSKVQPTDSKEEPFNNSDCKDEQETEKSTIQNESVSEGTNENLIPNISQKKRN